ncbi:MAG: Fe-S protein assembly co-chaperone HscB [Burkholderiaceae bacterium]
MLQLPDHFKLFNLTPQFGLDTAELDRAYRGVQAQVHPDRFASGTASEGRVAMQWATLANEAYRTLKSPLKRAAYLCELAGTPIDAESNTSMPAMFLTRQLEWREALDDARTSRNRSALQTLQDGMAVERDRLLGEIARALDVDADHLLAASLVRQLMFIEKFASEISAAFEAQRGNHASA